MYRIGDIAVFDHVVIAGDGGKTTVRHVAVRRPSDGQWDVAVHGCWRVKDDFIEKYGTVIGNVNDITPPSRELHRPDRRWRVSYPHLGHTATKSFKCSKRAAAFAAQAGGFVTDRWA